MAEGTVKQARRGARKSKPARPKAGKATASGRSVDQLIALVTELEHQNAALREASLRSDRDRQLFSSLYDQAPVGFLTLDEEGAIRRLNLTAAALLGGVRGEAVGTRLLTFVRPRDKASVAAFLRSAFEGLEPASCEASLAPAAGRVEHVQLVTAAAASGRDPAYTKALAHVALLDVTDRKRAEEALRASERLHEAVVSAMTEGVVVLDRTGSIQANNAAAERILGLSAAAIHGREPVGPGWRTVQEDGRPFPGHEHPAILALVTGLPRRNVVMGIHRSDGGVAWIRVNAEPLRRDDGTVQGSVATFTDVTEERRREAELLETSTRLSHVLEGSNAGSFDWNVPLGRVDVSHRLAAMLGYALDELVPDASIWDRLDVPEDLLSAMAGKGPHVGRETGHFRMERRLRHKDGHLIWVLVRGKVAERDGEGRPIRVAGIFTDVSSRKAAEEALQASEARFRLLADAAPIGVFQTSARGQATYVNPAWLALTGLTEEEAYGPEPGRKAIHPEDWQRVTREWRASVSEGKAFSGEYRLRDRNGKVTWVRGQGMALRDDGGGVTGHVGFLTEIPGPSRP